jgi:hypothetical protein
MGPNEADSNQCLDSMPKKIIQSCLFWSEGKLAALRVLQQDVTSHIAGL